MKLGSNWPWPPTRSATDGRAGASEAIPELEAALDEPQMVEVEEAWGLHSFFPVREHAGGALRKIRGGPEA